MGPGGADTLSADPKELATEAGNAQDCAAKSQRMRTENTAGSISGKISGGKAASTVKTTSEHLSNELKDIEHQLSDYSDDLVATMRTIEQTDQDEAGMYRGMIPPGDAGGLAEGIGAGAGAGAADGGAAGGSGAAIGGGHSYGSADGASGGSAGGGHSYGSADGASGGSAGGGHSYGSANGGAGQLFGSPGASGMSSLLDGAGGGSVVGGHSYGSTESGQIVGSHGGHNSTGALGGIHSLMSGDSDSFSSHAGGSHPAPMPRVEGSGDPAPMPHAETSGNAAPMPHVETEGGKILPSVEQGHSYGSQLSGSGSSHGGSLGPAPMPQVETPGDPAPMPNAGGSGNPVPMPTSEGSGNPVFTSHGSVHSAINSSGSFTPTPMPHAAPSGDPVAMPHVETSGNPAPMPRIEPSDPPVFTRGGGADYGPRIPGVGADGGSFAPSPMPHIENPGNAVPLPSTQGSDAPAPMPRVHGSGGSSSAATA